MSEQQLTVAELLARSGKDKKTSGRRRRRSLEEGGVSVAELTGNIPKVDAKPVEGKHNTETIDGETRAGVAEVAAQKAAEAAEAEKAAAEKAAEPEQAPEAPERPETPAEQVKPEPAEQPEEAAEEKAQKEATEQSEETKAEGVDKPVKRTPSNDETIVLSVVDENEPVRLTTGTFPAVKKAEVAEKEAPVVDPLAGVTAAALADAKVGEPEEPEAEEADETQEPAVAATDGVDEANAVDEVDEDAEEAEDYDEYEEEDDHVSAGSVVLLSILGIVLGIAAFVLFTYLWGSLSTPVVAALAVLVTAVMMFVVYKMNTARPRLSMFLSAVVGLVLTFGPMLTVPR